jgi:hypothetical protein
MKKKSFLNLLLFAFLFLVVGGCDLLEDKEHCQDEMHESKIWTPEQYPVNSNVWDGFGFIFFSFANSVSLNGDEGFKLSEVCPYGPIYFKATLREKNPHPDFRPKINYSGNIIEIVENGSKTGYVKKVKESFELKQVSDFGYQGEGIIQLGGFEEQGGRDFYVVVDAQVVVDGQVLENLTNDLSYETVVKENVASVEYTVVYDKW